MCNKDIDLSINKKNVAYIVELHSRYMTCKVTICRSHKACFLLFLMTHFVLRPSTYIVFLTLVLVINDSDNTSCPWSV